MICRLQSVQRGDLIDTQPNVPLSRSPIHDRLVICKAVVALSFLKVALRAVTSFSAPPTSGIRGTYGLFQN